MSFNKFIKSCGYENVNAIVGCNDVREWQDGSFYTLDSSKNLKIMCEVENIVSEDNSLVPRLKTEENLSDIDKPVMWDAYLMKKGKNRELSPMIKGFRINKNRKCNFLDKGHLIARKFHDHIYKNIKDSERLFYKNVTSNIIYQFCDKNRGEKGHFGQLQFEQAVKNKLNKSKDDNIAIYYEVEPIFMTNIDKIPIGTRILAFEKDDTITKFNEFVDYYSEKIFSVSLPFHVFIPNYSEKFGKVPRRFYERGEIDWAY